MSAVEEKELKAGHPPAGTKHAAFCQALVQCQTYGTSGVMKKFIRVHQSSHHTEIRAKLSRDLA